MSTARLLKVRNTGEAEWTGKYGGAVYAIPAGEEIIVEESVVSVWLGWPGLVDDAKRKIMDRTNKFQHLRAKYGWHDGMGMTDEDWEKMRPPLEVFTLDEERVYTVLDDPTGEQMGNMLTPRTTDMADLQNAYTRQQAELEALRKLLEAKDPTSPASVDANLAAEIPEDGPNVPPAGPSQPKSRTKRRTSVSADG